MAYKKVCVETVVRFLRDGGMRPKEVIWEDGRRFSVDRLKDVARVPAHVSSVLPMRYRCVIGGQERALYFEEEYQRWFVEVPE